MMRKIYYVVVFVHKKVGPLALQPYGGLRFVPSNLVVPVPCRCTFLETCAFEDGILAKLMLDGNDSLLHLAFLVSLSIPLFLLNG